MKLAAIDIGSNAVRFLVSRVGSKDGKVVFKKLHYMRYPLQLGKDVFKKGKISDEKLEEFIDLMSVFNSLMKLYSVDHYLACATSAMREAKNGQAVAKKILSKTSIKVEIIDGDLEAQLISSVLSTEIDASKNCIHIDVGGGSTELNIYIGGKKAHSKSFDIGSVRNMNDSSFEVELHKIDDWVKSVVSSKQKIAYTVGTGGNIRKLHKMSLTPKLDAPQDAINYAELKNIRNELEKVSYEDKIEVLMLNPDRADVIVPAADIYLTVMESANIKEMRVPDIGLKDGIIQDLYQKIAERV